MKAMSIAYPVKKSNDGFFEVTYNTLKTYASNINVLLRTNEGELPFDYEFGLPLMSSLFEPGDQSLIDTLKSVIKFKIKKYIPGVNIHSINITSDNESININLKINAIEDPFNIIDINIGM